MANLKKIDIKNNDVNEKQKFSFPKQSHLIYLSFTAITNETKCPWPNRKEVKGEEKKTRSKSMLSLSRTHDTRMNYMSVIHQIPYRVETADSMETNVNLPWRKAGKNIPRSFSCKQFTADDVFKVISRLFCAPQSEAAQKCQINVHGCLMRFHFFLFSGNNSKENNFRSK